MVQHQGYWTGRLHDVAAVFVDVDDVVVVIVVVDVDVVDVDDVVVVIVVVVVVNHVKQVNHIWNQHKADKRDNEKKHNCKT